MGSAHDAVRFDPSVQGRVTSGRALRSHVIARVYSIDGLLFMEEIVTYSMISRPSEDIMRVSHVHSL